MIAKVIPLIDQRVASRVPIIPAHALSPGGALADTRGRLLRDLRISVTDRCNFRCTYCMPKSVFDKDYHFLPKSELLSFEEITSHDAPVRRTRRRENPPYRRRTPAAQKPRGFDRDAGRPQDA